MVLRINRRFSIPSIIDIKAVLAKLCQKVTGSVFWDKMYSIQALYTITLSQWIELNTAEQKMR